MSEPPSASNLTIAARYLRASRAAHLAWANSQPQYVIPGVLDEADAGTQSSLGVHLLEPADSPNLPLGGLDRCGTEPRLAPGLTANQSGLPEHPVPSHSGVVVGAALSTTTGTGANHCPVTRARPQKGL